MTPQTPILALSLAALLGAVTAPVSAQTRQQERALAEVIGRSPQAIGNVLHVKLAEVCGADVRDGRLRSLPAHGFCDVTCRFD